MKYLLSFLTLVLLFGCQNKEKVDLLVINGNIYTVNDNFDMAEAFAVKDGKLVEIGSTKAIQDNYEASEIVDAEGKAVFPGFIDAHCHFFGLGLAEQNVRLEGTKSYDEVLERLVAFQKEKKLSFITGRGWDQNDWENKEFPTKEKLDQLICR